MPSWAVLAANNKKPTPKRRWVPYRRHIGTAVCSRAPSSLAAPERRATGKTHRVHGRAAFCPVSANRDGPGRRPNRGAVRATRDRSPQKVQSTRRAAVRPSILQFALTGSVLPYNFTVGEKQSDNFLHVSCTYPNMNGGVYEDILRNDRFHRRRRSSWLGRS